MKFEIEIPAALLPYMEHDEFKAQQTALLLYPYIAHGDMSNGKAAELLGMSKTELLDMLICLAKWGYRTLPKLLKNSTAIFRH